MSREHHSASDATIPAKSRDTGAEAAPGKAPLVRGESIGRYIVVGRLGQGAMGAVYAAVDPDLNRKVAIKVLEKGADRLAREAQALAQLSHPNVVVVHDVGVQQGRPFVAMELVEGGSLLDWLKGGERSRDEILDMFIEAGRGLSAAHKCGILHRDFKPANVLVSPTGAKVADFGLARASGSTSGDSSGSLSSGDLSLTVTGAALGTPRFMAPEAHRGRDGDERTDQFAYCVALFMALYGSHPFPHDDLPSLVNAVTTHNPEIPPGSNVPARLREIVLRGLRRAKEDRYPSIDALLNDLDRFRRPRWPLWAGAVGVAGVLGAAIVNVQQQPDPCASVATALDGVWDQERRNAVGAALRAPSRAFADRASQDALATLDEYASQWRSARTEACQAAASGDPEERAPELRIACLDRARGVLAGVTDILADGDEAVAASAETLTDELPQLDNCSGPQVGHHMRLPDDREATADVLRLGQRLDRLWLEQFSGSGAALVGFDRAVADAEALGFAPLLARAVYTRSRVKELLDMYEEAAVDARDSLRIATAANADRIAADAAAVLLRIEVEHDRKPDRLPTLLALTDGYLERWPDDIELNRTLLASTAYALSASGRFAEANLRAERLRRLAMEGNDIRLHNQALAVMTMLMLREGRYGEAIAAGALQAALSRLRLGADHPDVADAWLALGQAYLHYGDTSAALDAYAYVRQVRVGRPTMVDVRVRMYQASAHNGAGEHQAAYDIAQQGFEILEALAEPDGVLAAALSTTQADAADELGRRHEAVGLYERSIEIRRALGYSEVQMLAPMANMATTHGKLGQYEKAISAMEKALGLGRVAYGDRHPETGTLHAMFGGILIDSGDSARAREELRTAIEILRTAQADDAPVLSSTRANLARAELGMAEYGRAIEVAELALQSSKLDPSQTCEAQLVRAQVLRRREDHTGSQRATQAALDAAVDDLASVDCSNRATKFRDSASNEG